ncbi:MAG: HAMP domain-containing protein [Chloroflexi bacterium]|nr:HAMP domain-containing protein [Chloroflexota bacterium]
MITTTPKLPIATKLILSFLLVVVVTSAIFSIVGVRLINGRIIADAQDKAQNDLSTAKEIYTDKLDEIHDVVLLTAGRSFLRNAIASGDMTLAADELIDIKNIEGLDLLTITDNSGNVLLRASNTELFGDNQSHNDLVNVVLDRRLRVAGTFIVSADDLGKESILLAEEARIQITDAPEARDREDTVITDGMMMGSAAPIFDSGNEIIGVVYAGVLLNRNVGIINKIKQTIFHYLTYDGKYIGTAAIFQDDVGISTSLISNDGSWVIGSRVSEAIYNQVVLTGNTWIGEVEIAGNGYIAAYEPIKNPQYETIGILHVGTLEQKYLDIRNQTITAFLTITIIVTLVAMILSYFISRRISVPIKSLAAASKEVARGNLDTTVEAFSNDELGEMAASFNTMAATLKERDRKLREFTRIKIMESERLALIGQLSANVAHELNNPLTGIVTYSHLLLERTENGDPNADFIQKIIAQANRCKNIIRGLLDFSRQRKPDKTVTDVNQVLQECISLVENQAAFHNVAFVKDFDAGLPTAVMDPSQIERVFINMIINAAEAMEGDGRLTVATDTNPSGEFVRIRFSDTGCGIAKEDMDTIFDPFFTTKDIGHGTGLGLAISYGIIKEHGGTVRVESELNKGTIFSIRLPVTGNGNGQGHSANGRQS